MFVKAAIFCDVLLREAALAAALVGLMILLFLGSWRSTIIIIISIPLSVLFSVIALSILGETINVMTLGGLALAVGMLVDEGTVTLENIFYHLEMGKPIEPAILDGAQQIVVPAFVTLFRPRHRVCTDVSAWRCCRLSISTTGGSCGVRVDWILPALAHARADDGSVHAERAGRALEHHENAPARPSRNPFKRFQAGFERTFIWVRDHYRSLLSFALARPISVIIGFIVFVTFSFALEPFLGEELLSRRRFRPDSYARSRPARHAHRGNGAAVRSGRADRAQSHSSG